MRILLPAIGVVLIALFILGLKADDNSVPVFNQKSLECKDSRMQDTTIEIIELVEKFPFVPYSRVMLYEMNDTSYLFSKFSEVVFPQSPIVTGNGQLCATIGPDSIEVNNPEIIDSIFAFILPKARGHVDSMLSGWPKYGMVFYDHNNKPIAYIQIDPEYPVIKISPSKSHYIPIAKADEIEKIFRQLILEK